MRWPGQTRATCCKSIQAHNSRRVVGRSSGQRRRQTGESVGRKNEKITSEGEKLVELAIIPPGWCDGSWFPSLREGRPTLTPTPGGFHTKQAKQIQARKNCF